MLKNRSRSEMSNLNSSMHVIFSSSTKSDLKLDANVVCQGTQPDDYSNNKYVQTVEPGTLLFQLTRYIFIAI